MKYKKMTVLLLILLSTVSLAACNNKNKSTSVSSSSSSVINSSSSSYLNGSGNTSKEINKIFKPLTNEGYSVNSYFAGDASDVYARVNITTDKNLTENDIKNIIVKTCKLLAKHSKHIAENVVEINVDSNNSSSNYFSSCYTFDTNKLNKVNIDNINNIADESSIYVESENSISSISNSSSTSIESSSSSIIKSTNTFANVEPEPSNSTNISSNY